MLDRLTTELQRHQPTREPHARWALVMLLAMALTGWAVYWGVTKEVHAQTGGPVAVIQWLHPTPMTPSQEVVAGATYRLEWQGNPGLSTTYTMKLVWSFQPVDPNTRPPYSGDSLIKDDIIIRAGVTDSVNWTIPTPSADTAYIRGIIYQDGEFLP